MVAVTDEVTLLLTSGSGSSAVAAVLDDAVFLFFWRSQNVQGLLLVLMDVLVACLASTDSGVNGVRAYHACLVCCLFVVVVTVRATGLFFYGLIY